MNLAYWLCQVAGWGSYIAVGLAISLREGAPRTSVLVGFAAFFLYSIALTHLLRGEIRRRAWLSMPFRKSIPRLAGASVATGLVLSTLVVVVNFAIQRTTWDRVGMLSLVASLTCCTIGWTLFYVAITSTRNLVRSQRAQGQAELKALENQINPHFLFNCLNTIRGMIAENPERARDMVTRLANILRYNLRHDRAHTAPLAEEMEVVADYLALESIRFEDRLRVQISIDPAAEQMPVPSMLLQTLVENAVKHGIANLADGGELLVQASHERGGLLIRVENSGRLAGGEGNGTGVGLKNARERLRLLYGNRASLDVNDGKPGRVSATVLIPV